MSKGHLICLVGCFDSYCQILQLIPPLRRKKFQHNTFLRDLSLINGWGRGTKENKVLFLKGLMLKGIGSETGTF